MVAVSDRMHLKPLLRSITFPQQAFVLALALGSVRLLEILPDANAFAVDAPDLPTDVASAAGYPDLAESHIPGNPEGHSGGMLASAAREAIDQVNADRMRDMQQLFDERVSTSPR
jgi:hypothetical protein